MTFEAACLEPDERELWTAANDVADRKVRAKSPCQDCLHPFAEEMRRDGRCNGEPGVTERGAPSDDPKVLERRAGWRETKRRQMAREAGYRGSLGVVFARREG